MKKTTRRLRLGLGFLFVLLGLHILVLQALNHEEPDMSFNEWMEMQRAQQQPSQEQE